MHSARDTPKGGFPHSEIHRSQLGYQLPVAYRRFQRLSSPLDAKSSAVCPLWFDQPTVRRGVRTPQQQPIATAALLCRGTGRPTGPPQARQRGLRSPAPFRRITRLLVRILLQTRHQQPNPPPPKGRSREPRDPRSARRHSLVKEACSPGINPSEPGAPLN